MRCKPRHFPGRSGAAQLTCWPLEGVERNVSRSLLVLNEIHLLQLPTKVWSSAIVCVLNFPRQHSIEDYFLNISAYEVQGTFLAVMVEQPNLRWAGNRTFINYYA